MRLAALGLAPVLHPRRGAVALSGLSTGRVLIGALAVLLAVTGPVGDARAAPVPTQRAPASGESVARRLDRMLARVAAPSGASLEALLSLWEAAELAPLVAGGPSRVEAAAEALAIRVQKSTPVLASEAALVLTRLRALNGSPPAQRSPRPGLSTAAAAALAGLPTGGLVLGPLPGPGFGSKATGETGKHGPTSWRRFALAPTGTLPLEDFLPSSGDAHAHVGFLFETGALTTRILLGSNGPMTATLDGQPLTSFDGERELADWQASVAVDLKPGVHWLEVTVGHRSLAPELTVRIPGADEFGAPESLTGPPSATAGWTAARRLPPSLIDLAGPAPRAAAPAATSPAALARDAALARLAWRIDPAPPSERRAASRLEAAIAAIAANPIAARDQAALADLYNDLGRAETTDPSRAIAAFEAADRLAGGHAQALSALLDVAEKAGLQARAADLARRLRTLDPDHPALIGHDLLRRFELGDAAAALPLAEAALKKTPTARLLSLTATLAERAGKIETAARASADVSASQLGASEPLERAARLYLRAGKKPLALAAIDRALALRPMAADLHLLRARTLASDGDAAALGDPHATPHAPSGLLVEAIAELDRFRAFHHQNPLYEELRGRLLILAGERGKAIEAFDRALELAPQNRELADYRRTLVEERGLAERWAEPIDTIVARAKTFQPRSEGAFYLLERTVTEVFQSGLASQFRQLAIRIDQPKSVDRFEDMIFPFTPGEDRLEVLEAEVVRKDGSRLRPRQIGEQRQ
ncbi:MAG: hypothetical protein JNJ59_22645, partial [Deltaproteobacteria bacterium]|nr:hypothetical protein [Deltaproteobacteria bacterium]